MFYTLLFFLELFDVQSNDFHILNSNPLKYYIGQAFFSFLGFSAATRTMSAPKVISENLSSNNIEIKFNIHVCFWLKKNQVPCKLRHPAFDFYLAAICSAKCFFSRSNDHYHCGQF